MKAVPPPATRRTRKFNPTNKVRALSTLFSKPFKSMYERFFPIGYEDKKGFHYEPRKD